MATDAEKTELLRTTAGAFVSAREHFFTKEGTPDWGGRTHAYRSWVRENMILAEVPAADASALQAAIRYHSGNILRGRLDSETLMSLGMRSASPRERSAEKQQRNSEILSVFGGGGQALTGADEIVAASRTIEAVLRRIRLDAVVALTPEARNEVAALAEAINTRSKAIAAAAAVT
ncbi:hypothetical protein [Cryobacterium sp. BB307]|uniref:hypothetical protein n=1 Tax=Cryobacterium sp. BB307 TaxID=2716317 RepID=UPI0014450337|nr:hypothetical protein [Cryobacterium sp. BB307]